METALELHFDPVADRLKQLYVRGDITLAVFERALSQLLDATSVEDIEDLMRTLPFGLTPPGRELDGPLRLNAGFSPLKINGRWQVGSHTVVHAGLSPCKVDFTEAYFDSLVTDLDVYAGMSTVTLVIPEHVHVQVAGRSGGVKFGFEQRDPVPGFPLLRMSAQSGMGNIKLVRPGGKRRRRR